jgi:serine/threonine protein kinase
MKLQEMHKIGNIKIIIKLGFSHSNLSTNNIYLNNVTSDVYLGPIKFLDYEENELWYSSPEQIFLMNNLNIMNDINISCSNDIWSIGCIITELFFIGTPLFQCFSHRDKIRKVIEILGIPEYEDVQSYLNIQEYNLITSTYADIHNSSKSKPLIYDLIEYKSNHFRKELFEIIMKCLHYNPMERPKVTELLSRIKDLDDLSFNYIDKKIWHIQSSNNYTKSTNYINNNNFQNLGRQSSKAEEIYKNQQVQENKNKNDKFKQTDTINNPKKSIISEVENEDYKNLNTSKIILNNFNY